MGRKTKFKKQNIKKIQNKYKTNESKQKQKMSEPNL